MGIQKFKIKLSAYKDLLELEKSGLHCWKIKMDEIEEYFLLKNEKERHSQLPEAIFSSSGGVLTDTAYNFEEILKGIQ